MKSEAVFITNSEDYDRCKSMNIPWEPETDHFPFLFDINDVKASYVDSKGDIIVYLETISEDTSWRLKYNKELWETLQLKFK